MVMVSEMLKCFEAILLRPNFSAHPAEKSLSRVGYPPFVFAVQPFQDTVQLRLWE